LLISATYIPKFSLNRQIPKAKIIGIEKRANETVFTRDEATMCVLTASQHKIKVSHHPTLARHHFKQSV
jgi:hypothetical protein